ncbi:MAG: hypothetical protein JNM11_07060 [Chitinimonas sp.]|nr:hypothetical protein [Chitinimonas sp.]
MKSLLAIAVLSLATTVIADTGEGLPHALKAVSRLQGSWAGTAEGSPGKGVVTRRYEWVLQGRYLRESNRSTYPPQEKNKTGETHEHLGMFSYDKARKVVMLRQFHQEGFVNTYKQSLEGSRPDLLQFDSESFENFSNRWRARETYEFLSDDEFIETFELAAPDQAFQVYSRNHFKRVGGTQLDTGK